MLKGSKRKVCTKSKGIHMCRWSPISHDEHLKLTYCWTLSWSLSSFSGIYDNNYSNLIISSQNKAFVCQMKSIQSGHQDVLPWILWKNLDAKKTRIVVNYFQPSNKLLLNKINYPLVFNKSKNTKLWLLTIIFMS